MDQGRQVFAVDLLERYAAKGRGVITCMAAGNDVIVLGTSKDIDLSAGQPGEQSIHRVFVDLGGSHCISTIVGSGGADTFYTHAKWTKPRILSRLNGLVVNAVAWNRQQITEDEKDKREKYIKPLFELAELPEAILGLQMETTILSNGTRYYVMAVIPTRLYSFTGIGSLETVFASYLDRAVHFMELPGEIPNSELHFFIKQRRAVHFAGLSGAGIYHGGLTFGAQHSSPNGDENFVENKAFLDYTKLSNGAEVVKPSSMAVSEFHFCFFSGIRLRCVVISTHVVFLLLMVSIGSVMNSVTSVLVVNRISEQIIEELQFEQASDSSSRGIIGQCSDASAGLFYAYDQNSIFQVSVNDEGQGMWKVYLDMKEYAAALANSRDLLQRDQVYLVQAEAAFTSRDFLRAASFYAKVNSIFLDIVLFMYFVCYLKTLILH
ncbi:hypothetical protein CRYUN_Cryun18bG0061800 [Craigia yunnanensis]